LATIHQRHRQTDRTGQTGQRSDSTGQTILQTVAQKLTVLRPSQVSDTAMVS